MPSPLHGRKHRWGVMGQVVSSRLRPEISYRSYWSSSRIGLSAALANARAHEDERPKVGSAGGNTIEAKRFFSNISHDFRTPPPPAARGRGVASSQTPAGHRDPRSRSADATQRLRLWSAGKNALARPSPAWRPGALGEIRAGESRTLDVDLASIFDRRWRRQGFLRGFGNLPARFRCRSSRPRHVGKKSS